MGTLADNIPSSLRFDEDTIEALVSENRSQSFTKGRDLVKCGNVTGVELADRGSGFTFRGYVESEFKVNNFYKVQVLFVHQAPTTLFCACEAGEYAHPCKHKFALLFALFCLKNHKEEEPSWAPRVALYRRLVYKGKPQPGFEQARGNLSWAKVMERLVEKPSGLRGEKVTLIDAVPKKKSRAWKTHCICKMVGEESQGRAMIQCDACGCWYHEVCLQGLNSGFKIADYQRQVGSKEKAAAFLCNVGDCKAKAKKAKKTKKAKK